jgi:putative ABC transport system substrate-binding protein
MFDMRRREFISLLGGAAAAWPLAARAQQSAMPVIGFLASGPPDSDVSRIAAVRQGLKESGYVEGRNLAIEYRWAEDHYDRLPTLAADLVRRQVAVIVAVGTTPAAFAAKAATTTIPIVFMIGGDPVQFGLVASLNRPGGNITGVSFLNRVIVAKQLEMLHETAPKAAVIGFLVNATNPYIESDTTNAEAAAGALGRKLLVLKASTESEVGTAFATLVQRRAGALLIAGDRFLNHSVNQLVTLAARYAMPVLYPWREAALAGGLMSYGANIDDAFRQGGMYAGKILKGDKPADLPVQQAVKVELVVNLKTARALGLTVPLPLLALADEVIE